jgi:hypothetical protein
VSVSSLRLLSGFGLVDVADPSDSGRLAGKLSEQFYERPPTATNRVPGSHRADDLRCRSGARQSSSDNAGSLIRSL